MTWELVRRAKARHEVALLSLRNVVGLAVGHKLVGGVETSDACVAVLVRRKVPVPQLRAPDVIPTSLDGVLTDVIETGDIMALDTATVGVNWEATSRWRPAPGGVSIGHHRITAGTIGCVVRRGSESFILSNNHVLADSNNGLRGDEILQPAPLDGGRRPDDVIGLLEDWVPLFWVRRGIGRLLERGRRRNRVDAAVARPLQREDVVDEIHLLGSVKRSAEAVVGQSLLKSGRTTGLTRGKVSHVDATVTINYGREVALFENQVLATPMSEGGDSGSLVLERDGHAVGLLFAGSNQVTVLNRIQDVLKALQVQFSTE